MRVEVGEDGLHFGGADGDAEPLGEDGAVLINGGGGDPAAAGAGGDVVEPADGEFGEGAVDIPAIDGSAKEEGVSAPGVVGAGGGGVVAVGRPGAVEVGGLEGGDFIVFEIGISGGEVFHGLVEGADGGIDFSELFGEVGVDVLVGIEAADVDEEDLALVTEAVTAGDELGDGLEFICDSAVCAVGGPGGIEIEPESGGCGGGFGDDGFILTGTADDGIIAIL